MGISVNLAAMNSRQWEDRHYSNALPGRKSNLRLNDQIIPKPTDINMGEKTIKVPTPKEHPYASHIPRFAMFPSYASVDGSAKEEQPNVHSIVPKSAPDVTLLSKTKGSAYRHELLKPPTRTKKAVTWAGEHGFQEYPKPHKGESQVFYPTPKTLMLPKSKEDLPSSAQTNNKLKTLAQTHWLTSYQMHYSGYDKGSLKTDYVKKLHRPTVRNSHTAPQRDKPTSVFDSSKLEDDCRRPNDARAEMRGPCAPHPGTLASSLQRTAKSAALPWRPQESSAHHNEDHGPNQRGHSERRHSGGLAQAQRGDLSRRESHKQCYVGLESEESITKAKQYTQEAGIERPVQDEETRLKARSGKDGMDLLVNMGPPAQGAILLPQHPVLPGIRPLYEGRSLKELQDSYSRTRAHHRFNSSSTRTSVNPRDNVCTGRRHDFYGVNAFYLHG